MEEFTYLDLQKVWKRHGFTNWQIANEIGVSEEVIKGWLRSDPLRRTQPHPDDVGRIERVCKAESELIWHRWMMSNCESYRERHSAAHPTGLLSSVIGVRYSLLDVLKIQEESERDVIDGTFDDPKLRNAYRTALETTQAKIAEALAQVPKE